MKINIIKAISFFTILTISSCSKQESITIESQNEKNAIDELKSIVGNSATIIVLKNKSNSNGILNENISLNATNDSLKMLPLEEFKSIYKALNDTIWFVHLPIIANSSIYSTFSDDDSSRPGRAGMHLQSLYLSTLLYGSSTRSLLPTLNILYYTDLTGRVYGQPTIYHTGLTFFSWTQQTNNSIINFNPTTYTSTFTIRGTTLFGISIGGLNLGVTLGNTYKVVVHMNSAFGEDGWVDITNELEGLK